MVVQREVSVGMDVDKAGRDAQAFHRKLDTRLPPLQFADSDYPLARDSHIRAEARVSQPVEHGSAPQQNVATPSFWHATKDTSGW
jgi:hypothetical protein